jgi:cyclic 2,3-diphosphoglycerate synthetase
VIALVDGEHQPDAVRDALDSLHAARGVAGVVFCGGGEKLPPGAHERAEELYGRPVAWEDDPVGALARVVADSRATTVVDLADEPVLGPAARLRLAAHALHLGLVYEAPGLRLAPPAYVRVPFEGPTVAVIGTAKRVGKTAVAGHLAGLMRDEGLEPVVIAMGRGGPDPPRLAPAGTGPAELRAEVRAGRHGASDYLEDAALAGVAAVGCRRVGGGLAGEPHETNVLEGAALAAAREPGALVFEGSGACLAPVEVDRTVCVVGDPRAALEALGPYRLLRADLVLLLRRAPGEDEVERLSPGRTIRAELRAEPAEPLPTGARVALFTTGAPACPGVEAVVASPNLSHRARLAHDLERAADERCDVYLTELKGAAIDTVAERALTEGARVVFLRHRPVGLDVPLDPVLLDLVPVRRGS